MAGNLGSASASNPASASAVLLNPFRVAMSVVGYLGQVALLVTSALRAMFRHSVEGSFLSETSRQLDRLLSMGLPMVGLVHVGIGSFLSMQAYFGATFMDGIGPVTGVGLIRNLAPMLTGFILAGIVAARYVAELSVGRVESDAPEPEIEPGRRVATRLVAASIAGPVLSVWGSLVGIAIGWLVANSMMGLTLPAFFDMFLEMLWVRDIVGLVVKGSAFSFMAALLACHEGLTRPVIEEEPANLESIGLAAARAVCLAGLAILFINSAWFLLIYHAGPAFGPTVLSPPSE